jgi:phenylacetic acid degradation operon negative regulatory protein
LQIDSQIDTVESSEKWDGIWTVVVFGIPETLRKRRNELRNELIMLGFGMLFGSVWISPYNKSDETRKLIRSLRLEKHAVVFQCQTDELKCCNNVMDIVYRVWNLKRIESLYKTHIKGWEQLAYFLDEAIKKNKQLEARKLFPKILKMQLDMMDVYVEEPALPKELLPKNWIGFSFHDLVHYTTNLLNKMTFSDEYAYLVQVHEIRGVMLPPSKLCVAAVKKN